MTRFPRQIRLVVVLLAALVVASACSTTESGSSLDTAAAAPAQEPLGTTIDEATEPPSAPEEPATTESETPSAPEEPATTESEPPSAPEEPATTESEPADAPAPAEEAVEAEPIASDLPEIAVIDVNSGGEFVLADLAPSDRPILLWMWAPH